MVQIKYANEKDYDLILTIDNSISPEKWKVWTAGRQVIFAFADGELAGWLQYSLFIEKLPFVNRLYVFEKHQKKCIGTGLMKFWEFEMVERGYTQLMLSTELTASGQEFYKKLGYRVLGEFDYFSDHTELMLGKEIELSNYGCCKC